MRYEAHLSEGTERDQQKVRALWLEGMRDPRILASVDKRLSWFYETNPLGPARTWFVSDTQNGEVIGCASAYPRRVYVDGEPLVAGCMADFLVSKKHRIAGPAIQLQRTLAEQSQEAGFAFIYGYPNRAAWPIFKRIGFTAPAKSRMWVKPLEAGYKIGSLVDERLEPYLGPKLREKLVPTATKVGSVVGDRVLQANDMRLSFGKPKGLFELCDRAPAELDSLESRGSDLSPISGARDAAYLNWRYADHASEAHRFFVWRDPAGMLLGWVVYRVAEDRVFLLDALWSEGVEQGAGLLVAFSRSMRQEGHVSICVTYAGRDDLVEVLPNLGFFEREGARSLIVYATKNAPEKLRERITDPESWALFDGELDI